MSPDGYITITGRIKDLIIRGGENIHPLEIENCLLAHPAVGDVSVVGVPDERYGEAVAAFVIPKEEQRQQGKEALGFGDDIKEWVRGKLSNHLGRFTRFGYSLYDVIRYERLTFTIVPRYVFTLSPSDTLPKTASGKIQKFKLKEFAIRVLNENRPN